MSCGSLMKDAGRLMSSNVLGNEGGAMPNYRGISGNPNHSQQYDWISKSKIPKYKIRKISLFSYKMLICTKFGFLYFLWKFLPDFCHLRESGHLVCCSKSSWERKSVSRFPGFQVSRSTSFCFLFLLFANLGSQSFVSHVKICQRIPNVMWLTHHTPPLNGDLVSRKRYLPALGFYWYTYWIVIIPTFAGFYRGKSEK